MTLPIDTDTIVAARFPQDIVKMIDGAREKMADGGAVMARNAFMKQSVYWYLSYLGYTPPRPTIGGRRRTKENHG